MQILGSQSLRSPLALSLKLNFLLNFYANFIEFSQKGKCTNLWYMILFLSSDLVYSFSLRHSFSLKYIFIQLFGSLGKWLPRPRPLQGRTLLGVEKKPKEFWICLLGIQIVGFLNERLQCHTNKPAIEKHLYVCNWRIVNGRDLDAVLMWISQLLQRNSACSIKPPNENQTQFLVMGPDSSP